jgi:hypothetical protein
MSGRGGKRVGAGRKKLTDEQRMNKQQEFQQIIIDELIFPAVCAAWHAHPGRWKERQLSFELSAVQIRDAYGHEGLKEWRSFFTAVRRGGSDRDGNAYQTLWTFNLVKYGFILKLVRELGHDIKDMPNPGFPPVKMLERLAACQARREARKKERVKAKADVIQAIARIEHEQKQRQEALQ